MRDVIRYEIIMGILRDRCDLFEMADNILAGIEQAGIDLDDHPMARWFTEAQPEAMDLD